MSRRGRAVVVAVAAALVALVYLWAILAPQPSPPFTCNDRGALKPSPGCSGHPAEDDPWRPR